MARERIKWSDRSMEALTKITEVINKLTPHWPVTLRMVYYQLVASGAIPNAVNEYKKLSRILTAARLDNKVPWAALEDRSRSMRLHMGWDSAAQFISSETSNFLEGYNRDLSQGQDVRLEVWVEKDALSSVVSKAARRYNVPVVVAKGFGSISFVHDCCLRIKRDYNEHRRQTRILYFGDFDPSGWEMLPAMMETLQDEMGLGEIVVDRRIALTEEQVEEFDLPFNPDAFKVTDSRAKKFADRFGEVGYELDALDLDELASMVKNAIEDNFDMDEFQRQIDQGERDDDRIIQLKDNFEEAVQNIEDEADEE